MDQKKLCGYMVPRREWPVGSVDHPSVHPVCRLDPTVAYLFKLKIIFVPIQDEIVRFGCNLGHLIANF